MSIPIPLRRVDPNPWNTRTRYDNEYVQELADDIARNGLLQPPVGRLVDGIGRPVTIAAGGLRNQKEITGLLEKNTGWRIQLAFGHSRWRATSLLASDGRHDETLDIRLRPLTDEQMADMAWAENEQRKDLTPIEEAAAIQLRMDDFGWTQAEVAGHLGLARSTVANKVRLLALPDAVKEALAAGTISERAAMALVPLFDLSEEQEAALPVAGRTILQGEENQRSVLVRSALGGMSSNELREKAALLLRRIDAQVLRQRYLPARLPVSDADFHKITGGGVVHAGLCYGSRHGARPETVALVEVGAHRLVVTGSLWSSDGERSAYAHEALTDDEFSARPDNPDPEHEDAFQDYGNPFRFEEETYLLGYRCTILPAGDDAEPLPVTIHRPTPKQFRGDDDEPRGIDAALSPATTEDRTAGGTPEPDGYFIAYDSEDHVIWGAGETEKEALEEANEYGAQGFEGFTDAHLRTCPASLELMDKLDLEGAHDLIWHIAGGVATLGAGGANDRSFDEAVAQNYANGEATPSADLLDLAERVIALAGEIESRSIALYAETYDPAFYEEDIKLRKAFHRLRTSLANLAAQVRVTGTQAHAARQRIRNPEATRTVALVACSKEKHEGIHPARELYASPLFRKSLAHAESLQPDAVGILSAQHGLVWPDQHLRSYDRYLGDLTAEERRQWAQRVLVALRGHFDLECDRFIVLAGRDYREHLAPEIERMEVPMEGLGIGEQMAWLEARLNGTPVFSETETEAAAEADAPDEPEPIGDEVLWKMLLRIDDVSEMAWSAPADDDVPIIDSLIGRGYVRSLPADEMYVITADGMKKADLLRDSAAVPA